MGDSYHLCHLLLTYLSPLFQRLDTALASCFPLTHLNPLTACPASAPPYCSPTDPPYLLLYSASLSPLPCVWSAIITLPHLFSLGCFSFLPRRLHATPLDISEILPPFNFRFPSSSSPYPCRRSSCLSPPPPLVTHVQPTTTPRPNSPISLHTMCTPLFSLKRLPPETPLLRLANKL